MSSPDDCVLSPTNESVENVCTLYGYDAAGNRVTITNALDQTSLTVYDEINRPIVNVANWDGIPITGEMDCAFPPTRSDINLCTVTYYDERGRRSANRDPMGNRTEFGYDSQGRLITTTRYLDGAPVVTVSHYDALGNRVGQSDALGHTTTYVYDYLNRLAATVSAEGVATVRGYDEFGRVVTTTDNLGHQTLSDYDILGRRVAVTDAENNVTHYAYDALGKQVAITDANGVRTSYLYDGLNRLVAVVENDTGGAPTHDSDVLTQYVYDVLGNRVVITNALGYTSTHTTYDALNRRVAVKDALGHETTTRYNALGYRTVVTDANGAVTRYSYDDLNRLNGVHYISDNVTVTYRYDALGNRTAMTDTLGVTRYVYDDLYRLVSVNDPFTGTVSYGYDLIGNRTHLTYPDSKVATHTYDADNRLVQVEDWSGGLTGYEYDVVGRLIATALPNGVATTYRYDAANRLIDLVHTTADDTLLSSYSYELDGAGNRVRAVEALTETSRTITYTYDHLYRLTGADYSSGENFQYVYDAAGNMTAVTTTITSTVVVTKAYDAANRLTTVATNGAVRTLEWSDAGELLRDGDDTYEWDAAGRMVRATVDRMMRTHRFAYLGDGSRISMTVGSETTTYTLDLAAPLVQVLAAYQSTDPQSTTYLYGVARIGEYDGAWQYHLMDHLGSVRSLVGADGSIEGTRAYQPYGSLLSSAGSASSVYGFTGEQTDPTGLIYLRARMYAPSLGQFTSRDLWPGSVRRPGTLHAWSYVQGNPINSVDPTGHISWQDLIPLPAGGVVNLFKALYSKTGTARLCLFHDTGQHSSDTVDDLVTDFICEYGPRHRIFEADAHLTQQLAKTFTIHHLRREFYWEGNWRQEEREYVFDIGEAIRATLDTVVESDPTGYPLGLIGIPINITHFMATFEYEIWRDSLWVYWRVHNQTDLASGSRIPPLIGGVPVEQKEKGVSVEEVLETHPWYWQYKSIAAIIEEFDIISVLKAKTRDETGGFLGTEGGGNMEQTFRWREQYFGCDLWPWPAINTVLRIEENVPPPR